MKLQRFDIKDNGDSISRPDGQWIDADDALQVISEMQDAIKQCYSILTGSHSNAEDTFEWLEKFIK